MDRETLYKTIDELPICNPLFDVPIPMNSAFRGWLALPEADIARIVVKSITGLDVQRNPHGRLPYHAGLTEIKEPEAKTITLRQVAEESENFTSGFHIETLISLICRDGIIFAENSLWAEDKHFSLQWLAEALWHLTCVAAYSCLKTPDNEHFSADAIKSYSFYSLVRQTTPHASAYVIWKLYTSDIFAAHIFPMASKFEDTCDGHFCSYIDKTFKIWASNAEGKDVLFEKLLDDMQNRCRAAARDNEIED